MLVVLITMRKNKEKKIEKWYISSNVIIIIDDNTAYEVSWLLSQ